MIYRLNDQGRLMSSTDRRIWTVLPRAAAIKAAIRVNLRAAVGLWTILATVISLAPLTQLYA